MLSTREMVVRWMEVEGRREREMGQKRDQLAHYRWAHSRMADLLRSSSCSRGSVLYSVLLLGPTDACESVRPESESAASSLGVEQQTEMQDQRPTAAWEAPGFRLEGIASYRDPLRSVAPVAPVPTMSRYVLY